MKSRSIVPDVRLGFKTIDPWLVEKRPDQQVQVAAHRFPIKKSDWFLGWMLTWDRLSYTSIISCCTWTLAIAFLEEMMLRQGTFSAAVAILLDQKVVAHPPSISGRCRRMCHVSMAFCPAVDLRWRRRFSPWCSTWSSNQIVPVAQQHWRFKPSKTGFQVHQMCFLVAAFCHGWHHRASFKKDKPCAESARGPDALGNLIQICVDVCKLETMQFS